jgi:uncharacterized protein
MSAAPSKSPDPSMEEILASIRRIIADDDEKAPEAKSEPGGSEVAAAARPDQAAARQDAGRGGDEDVFDLAAVEPDAKGDTDLEIEVPELSFQTSREEEAAMPDEPEPAPAPRSPLLESPLAPPPLDFVARARRPEPAAERRIPEPPSPPRAERAEAPPSVERILSQQATASVGQAFNLLSHTIMSQNAHTLEDIVREMLKPMLKTWLDDNLPPLVERLVAAEIQRVARGQR